MKKQLLLTFIFSALALQSLGQNHTVRLMTYNILNYRNSTSYCNGTTNSASAKEEAIDTIVRNINPQIIVFNEVGSNANNGTYLLNNALNTGSQANWAMANYTHNGFSTLVNAIAYRSDLFGITHQWTISKDLNNGSLTRLIDVVRFYDKQAWPGGSTSGSSDSLTFIIVAAHFKAGNTASDENTRKKEADAIIDFVDNIDFEENIILMGDLNVYSSYEDAYQSLTAGNSFRFEDPVASPGAWHNSSTFAALHTQSTQMTSGCFSGGGLDDRFDQILISEAISEGDAMMTYSNNSYFAVGNDGNHFNQAINSGTNYSVTSDVLDALYSCSDHLPVICDFDMGSFMSTPEWLKNWPLPNPMPKNYFLEIPATSSLEIMNLLGQIVLETNKSAVIPALPSGTYLFKLQNNTQTVVKKIQIR